MRQDVLVGKIRNLNWQVSNNYVKTGDKKFDLAFTTSNDHKDYSKSTLTVEREAYIACHLVKDYNGNIVNNDKVEMGIFPVILNKSPGSYLYEFPLGFKGISGSAVFNKNGEFMGLVCGVGTKYGDNDKTANRGIMIPTIEIIKIINNGGLLFPEYSLSGV